MIDRLMYYDHQAFFFINDLSGFWLVDALMIAISSHSLWLVLLAIWAIYAFRTRYQYWWLALGLLLVTIGLTDLVAFEVIKPYFARLRPCKVSDLVNIVHSCGGKFSFPSNHATNSLALAGLVFWLGPRHLGLAFIALGLLVGFSRIYLGVHYPADVLVGSALGFTWASIISGLVSRSDWFKERIRGAFPWRPLV